MTLSPATSAKCKPIDPAEPAIDLRLKTYNDVKQRIADSNQVTFEESGKAFHFVWNTFSDPASQAFIGEVLVPAVDIFLQQVASVVNPSLLCHFEDVLKISSRIISKELRTSKNTTRLDLLGRILDESSTVYLDRKVVIQPGNRKMSSIRVSIAKELVTDGTFSLLFSLLKEKPFDARTVHLILFCANNAKIPEVNFSNFAECAFGYMKLHLLEDVRKQKTEDLQEIHLLLLLAFGPNHQEYFDFCLELWLRCFEFDNFAFKKFGLDHLITAAGKKSVCAWLVEKRVLDMLFQPSTHSALIGRSKSLLEHMAVAGVLGAPEVDQIFLLTMGGRQHEADLGAAYSLLAELVLSGSPTVSVLIVRRAILLPQTEDMFAFARKLVQLEQSPSNRNRNVLHKGEVQVVFLDLLWALLRASSMTEDNRLLILEDFYGAFKSAIVPSIVSSQNEDEVFSQYLAKITQVLASAAPEAWSMCSLLKEIVLLHPLVTTNSPWVSRGAEWTKVSQSDFVQKLEEQVGLIKWTVQHLNLNKNSPRIQFSLLSFLRLIVEKSLPSSFEFDVVELLWNALTNDFRLPWFRDLVPIVSDNQDLLEQIFCQLVAKLPLEILSSNQGFDCFSAYFSACSGEKEVDRLWELAILKGDVAIRASQILLLTKMHEPEFFSQIMEALSAHVLDDEKRQCILLGTAFLESQLIPDAHARRSGPLDLVVHHDNIFTNSQQDLGKVVEKRFKEDKSFVWTVGIVFAFVPEQNKHWVWFKEVGKKEYDFQQMSLDGAKHCTVMLYRMLSVVNPSKELLSVVSSLPQEVSDAMRKYAGLVLRKVSHTATVLEVKIKAIDLLGKDIVKPANLEGSKLEIQFHLETMPAVLPKCFEQRGPNRIAVCDESLQMGCLVSRFGTTWFLCTLLEVPPVVASSYVFPSFLFQSSHFEALMEILSSSSSSMETRRETWTLLMNLPTEASLLTRINQPDKFRWKDELLQRNILEQVYLLQIANSLPHDEISFFNPQVSCVVFDLFSQTIHMNEMQEWERNVSFQVVLRVMHTFALNKELLPVKDQERISRDLTDFVCGHSKNSSDESILSALSIMSMLARCDVSNHGLLLKGNSNRSLVDVLMESSVSIQELIYELLLGSIVQTQRLEVFECILRAFDRLFLFQYDTTRLFQFVTAFVDLGENDEEIALYCCQLLEVVRRKLTVGFLDLSVHLLDRLKPSPDLELVDLVLNKFVFIPKPEKKAFVLLQSLSRHGENLEYIVSRMHSFILNVSLPLARHGKSWDFHFRPDDCRRETGSFVGLVNQGATCYQNSILQQLFVRKQVRDVLMHAVPVETESTLLPQLQRVFCFLLGSDQKVYNPIGFVQSTSALPLTDGHMSQNDCAEFFTLLIDRLENELKGTPAREQLTNLFFSKVTSLTVRKCPHKHTTESLESPLYLALSIRYGLNGRVLDSLDEALDEWSRAEHLTELICDDCVALNKDQPVVRCEGDQPKFISVFPPLLVLQLKRFDFDYETYQPFKLNNRVSFNQRLDLGRFSKESVLKQYREVVEEDGKEVHIWYRLKGVVVHQGTGASFGHYYSFVEDENDSWFKFDDERVTPFNLSHLEEECFGGPDSSAKKSFNGLRINNCVLLIYAKEETVLESSNTKTASSSLSLPLVAKITWMVQRWKNRALLKTPLFLRTCKTEVFEENQRSLNHSIAFAEDFLSFCLFLLQNNEPSENKELFLSFGIVLCFRLIFFAESEKERLNIWMQCLDLLMKKVQNKTGASETFVQLVLGTMPYLERFLLTGAEFRSSQAFTNLLCLTSAEVNDEMALSLADALLVLYPKTAQDVFRLVDRNYFTLLSSLAGSHASVRAFFLERGLVFLLLRLMDEKMGIQVVRDLPTCAKIVQVLDSILFSSSDQSDGFPIMPLESSQALFSDSVYNILVQHAQMASRRLVPRLCDCNLPRVEKGLDSLYHVLNSSQWATKVGDAGLIIPDACTLLKELLLSLESEMYRPVRENHLTLLLKLAKEAKRQASERKEVPPHLTYYNTQYQMEKKDSFRAAVLLLVHLVDLLSGLALESGVYRAFLSLPVHKWPTLVSAVDTYSFELLGGNEPCGIRDVHIGKIVRKSALLSVSLGHLPRPITLPSYTLSFSIDEAGSEEVNGVYHFDGFFAPNLSDSVDVSTPKFSRIDDKTKKKFTIFRCRLENQQQSWFLSEVSSKPGTMSDIDYYQVKDFNGLPDITSIWVVCGVGLKPAPKYFVQNRSTPNPEMVFL